MAEFTIRAGNQLCDVSLVSSSSENPEIASIKSFGISFFNNMVMTCFKLISLTNLILLGHILYNEKVDYQLFMTFQIGVFILEVLGKYFIIGLLKYIFGEYKNIKSSYLLYIKLKTALIFLIPFVTIPVSICSYFLLKLIFKDALQINDFHLINEVYKKYLLFTPAIYFFEILFLLNLKFLNIIKMIRSVFIYIICFLASHVILSWILLYILDIGLIGLTISYCLNSLIFFFATDKKISIMVQNDTKDHFHLIPNKSNLNFELFGLLLEISKYSLINLIEALPTQLIFFASLFIDNNSLIVNIIYISFYEFVTEIARGFYYTIKREVFNKYNDINNRQLFLLLFSGYYLIIIMVVFVVLLIFKNILLNIYIFKGGEKTYQKIASSLRILYSLCILSMSVKLIINGIVRGMEIPMPNARKLIYLILFAIVGYYCCFEIDFGILGLWFSMIILDLFYISENLTKVIKYFPFSFTS